jgi:acyl carrier protein
MMPPDIEPTLRNTVAEILGVDVGAVTDESSVDTIESWDSLAQINLLTALEDEFGVRFPDDDVSKLTSVAALRGALESLLSA